jgi:site-specific DNA recombinase
VTKNVALIYTRVSKLDARDRDRALSPATQLARCKELPALRGLEVEHFEDLDFSGKNTKRPQFLAMLERIQRGDVALIAAYSLSRISRSVSDFYRLYEDALAPAGVAFVSATEPIDTLTPQGRAFMGMTAVWAQMERELTSERIRDSFEHAAQGGRLVGTPPFRYKRVDGQVVVDEAAAAVVKLVFAKYASGTASYGSLARWLNTEGIRPPSFGLGRKNDRPDWATDGVREIVARETYVGRFVHGRGRSATRRGRGIHGPAIQGNYPAIIDEETWQASLAVRRRNGIQHAMHYDHRRTRYALTGLLRCESCGGSVHGLTTGRERNYYSCRRRLDASGCGARNARSDDLEGEVREWLAALRLPGSFETEFTAAAATHSAPAPRAPANQRKVVTQRLERLADLYELGHMVRDEYLAKRAGLDTALRLIAERPKEERSRPAMTTHLSTIVDRWQEMNAGQRRRLLDTVFDELVVGEGRLVSATPKAGWLDYFDEATAQGDRVVTCGQRGV